MGLPSMATPREHSLCLKAIDAGQMVVCPSGAAQLQAMADLAYGLEALFALRFLAGSHGLALDRVADLAQEANTDGLTGLLNP